MNRPTNKAALRSLTRKQDLVDLLGEKIERMGALEEHLKSV